MVKMMTKEENDLLTQTGPGTPCGELMRRYWQPAALSEELPPDSDPLGLKLLAEDLVLFRDDKGHPGLLGLHCSHRGADLSYGRLEDGGLRCLYHGWLYDVSGCVLDMPAEPHGGGEYKKAIRHKAYPCQEAGGVIFAYMGPGEPPLLPNYEFLMVPPEHRYVTKGLHECNYLQASEGNLDPMHNTLLHHPFQVRGLEITGVQQYQGFRGGRGAAPEIETIDAEMTDFGMRLCRMCPAGPDKKYIRIFCFALPALTPFPGGPQGEEGYSVNWHVPIDDARNWKFMFTFNREKPLSESVKKAVVGGVGLTPDYRFVQNRANRYMQDRQSLKTRSYSGIDGVPVQDLWAVEGAGPMQDRTQEHLAASDRAIVVSRKVVLKAIREVQEGREPPHIIRDPKLNRFPNMIIHVNVVPSSTDWKEYCKKLEAESRA
jgi:phenylpropionate dioxygenase-like ring-hydroxylating dioxygenase large terminal subunit